MVYGGPPNGPYGEQNPQYSGPGPNSGGYYPQGDPYSQQPYSDPAYGSPYQQQPSYGGNYQQPSYGSPYQQNTPQWGGQPNMPQGQPPRRSNVAPIIAAAVVAVLVLAGVGTWLVLRPSPDTGATSGSSSSSESSTSRTRTTQSRTTESSTPTTTRTTAPSGTVGDPAAQQELFSALPNGYSESNCQGSDPKGALARVVCQANSDSGGPTAAVFAMYADQPSLDRAFNSSDSVADTAQLRDCPDGTTSPSGWTYNSEPDVTAGYVACGISEDNTAQVTWSKYNDMTMGYVVGPDLKLLHDWWWEYG